MDTQSILAAARKSIRRACYTWNIGQNASVTLKHLNDAEKAIADAKARLLAHMGD